MECAGQALNGVPQLWQVAPKLLHHTAGFGAARHPLLQQRIAGFPQVQFGIELPAQALDVEQRLVQQQHLRLQVHVEFLGGGEDPAQDPSEAAFAQRPGEDRLPDDPEGSLQVLGARIGRDPSPVQVQPRQARIVLLEEGQQRLAQVVMVALVEYSHDAEIHGGVAGVLRIADVHEHVSGMHVGMEEAVPEHLGEKDLHAPGGQLRNVHAGVLERLHVPDGGAVYALHDQHVRSTVVPVHGRHVDDVGAGKAALQARGVGPLAGQVQFVAERALIFLDDFDQAQAVGGRPPCAGQPRHAVEQLHVAADARADARAQQLDHDFLAVRQARGMDLRNRGGRQRFRLEFGEYFFHRTSVEAAQQFARFFRREWRYVIL